jgi:hypothetical protein
MLFPFIMRTAYSIKKEKNFAIYSFDSDKNDRKKNFLLNESDLPLLKFYPKDKKITPFMYNDKYEEIELIKFFKKYDNEFNVENCLNRLKKITIKMNKKIKNIKTDEEFKNEINNLKNGIGDNNLIIAIFDSKFSPGSKRMAKFLSDFSEKLFEFKIVFLKIDFENNENFINKEMNVNVFPFYKIYKKNVGLIDESVGVEPVVLLKKINKFLFN